MENRNFYEILGVSHDATESEIKRAYRKLAIKFHPDKNNGSKKYINRFLEVAAAYEVLSDAKKRKEYNALLLSSKGNISNDVFEVYKRSFNGFSSLFNDIYNDFVGFYNKKDILKKKKGGDIKLTTDITLHQAAFGTKKTIEYDAFRKCTLCNGSGAIYEKDKSLCPSCAGVGIIEYEHGFFKVQRICRECEGDGFIIKNPCHNCNGDGRVKKKIKKTFKIPPGIESKSSLRISNKGNVGIRGGKAGDLYLYINVLEHEFFKRNGNDINCEVPISFTKAALGGVISVPTLNGEKKIKIRAGTQSGERIEIKGEGIIGKNNKRGSQFVKLIVTTPQNLTEKEISLFRELEKSGRI
ncbi:MAG: molecular chaperone DnaJ [Candidatus Schekmanbacteria bacterium]|nr:MAG: molecular chaperone DnaJ [Candidatus Schekmanbacteria bacterium]